MYYDDGQDKESLPAELRLQKGFPALVEGVSKARGPSRRAEGFNLGELYPTLRFKFLRVASRSPQSATPPQRTVRQALRYGGSIPRRLAEPLQSLLLPFRLLPSSSEFLSVTLCCRLPLFAHGPLAFCLCRLLCRGG